MALIGKKLIIIGADWSDVAIGKLKVSLSKSVLQPSETATLTLTAPSVTSPTFSATISGAATISGSAGSYTITAGSSAGTATVTCGLSYTEGGETKSESKTLTITVQTTPVPGSYTITGNITNGSLTGASSVAQGGSATVTIVPNSGYSVPADATGITVTNATKGTYNAGQLTITNATGNVTITATCGSSEPVWYSDNVNYTVGQHVLMAINAKGVVPDAATEALYRDKPINMVRFVNYTETSGTLKLFKTANFGASEQTEICSLPWTATDEKQIIELDLPSTVTITGTEYIVFSSFDSATNADYCNHQTQNNNDIIYTRVPTLNPGQTGTQAWQETKGFRIDYDFGYKA